jgi:aminoglycoside phosphotransferase (APT) family kinase protein
MSSSKVDPPRTIKQVTCEWLSAALQEQYPGVKVTRADVGPLFGNKPNKARIKLKYNAAGERAGLPPSMVVKATFPGLGTGAAGLDIATAAEVLAYHELVPLIKVNTPRIFHSVLDWKGGNAMMLMEDLALRGFHTRTALLPFDYSEAMRFVEALAALHAQTWNSPEFAPGGRWGPESRVADSTRQLHALFLDKVVQHEWWKDFDNEPQSVALPRILRDQPRIEAAWHSLKRVLGASARAIIHGDTHLGNLYTDADGTPGFLDWFARVEPWAFEYAYFLSNSLDSLDRRAWEQPMLSRYLRTLNNMGVDAPTFDEAWYSYRCALVFPLIVWYTNPTKWQPAAINTACVARAALAMIDHDTLGLLGL